MGFPYLVYQIRFRLFGSLISLYSLSDTSAFDVEKHETSGAEDLS